MCAVSHLLPSVLKPTPEVALVAATNATATVGTVLLICPNQVTQSNNNDYLSQKASQNLEPELPQVPPPPCLKPLAELLWKVPFELAPEMLTCIAAGQREGRPART